MTTTTRKQTTTRINGKRIRLVTVDGKTTATAAPTPEWELQAEAVRQLKAMPEFDKTFTLAADFAAGKRDGAKAKATGVTAGDPDLRIYAAGGRLLLIEYKNAEGSLSADRVIKGKKRGGQKERHALLRSLGYTVIVIKAATPVECAAASVAAVRGWLAHPSALAA